MHIKIIFIKLMIIFIHYGESRLKNDPPSVVVKSGRIEGLVDQTLNGRRFNSFLGIPYAKAPIGDLRFENPAPAEQWSGTLSAKTMPEMCLQTDMHQMLLMKNFTSSGKEDCLYLNVFTPKIVPDAKMAVMVFIHGGGFFNGAANDYHPHVLLDEDIVLVVIQYRLGVLGFLSTGDEVLPGNLGLKDQTFALKWIGENIEEFGGDRNRVTIFGQSAGGASVHFHILSPLSKGLFHRAIMHSGTSLVPWSTVTHQRKLAEKISTVTNCPLEESDGGFKECLKKIDSHILLDLSTESFKWGVAPILASPRVDGEFLPEDPMTLMKKKKYNKVNVISGVTRDDGAFFSGLILKSSDLMSTMKSNFGENSALSLFMDNEESCELLAKRVFDFYLGENPVGETFAEEITQMFGHGTFIVAHDLTSLFFASDDDVNMYRYELIHRGHRSLVDLYDFDYGSDWVTHGDDLLYLFHGGKMLGTLPLTNHTHDLKMREIFVKLWVQFARTGTPTASNILGFEWKAATASKFEHLALQPQPEMHKDSREKIRQFWLSLPTRQNKLLFEDDKNHFFTYDHDIKPMSKLEL